MNGSADQWPERHQHADQSVGESADSSRRDDREVAASPPIRGDSAEPASAQQDRRRSERRKIDRMSTGI
ncbi:MAG TPA: hypothetical protein VIV65_07890 [Gemmatimonadaceae bacterium]|jgi:hypothetical protein